MYEFLIIWPLHQLTLCSCKMILINFSVQLFVLLLKMFTAWIQNCATYFTSLLYILRLGYWHKISAALRKHSCFEGNKSLVQAYHKDSILPDWLLQRLLKAAGTQVGMTEFSVWHTHNRCCKASWKNSPAECCRWQASSEVQNKWVASSVQCRKKKTYSSVCWSLWVSQWVRQSSKSVFSSV